MLLFSRSSGRQKRARRYGEVVVMIVERLKGLALIGAGLFFFGCVIFYMVGGNVEALGVFLARVAFTATVVTFGLVAFSAILDGWRRLFRHHERR